MSFLFMLSFLSMDYINNMFALSSDLCNFLFSVRETVSKAVFGGNIALGN